MDLETENRIAAILLKEAAELRRQAEKEGVLAYLRQPNVRGRPNSRFLTATVLGIQQANRAVEVSEMWRVRQKELELDNRLKRRSSSESGHCCDEGECSGSTIKRQERNDRDNKVGCSSSKKVNKDCDSREEEGLRDEEVEEFLHSRVKRGRGAIGSRMDETGPYLSRSTENHDGLFKSSDHVRGERQHQDILGPEKPSCWKPYHSSDDEQDDRRRKRSKKLKSGSSKEHSRKHKLKESSRGKKKKRKQEKRHHH
ncbi:hypothetical protein Ancab_008136 [Ancistrocladus abbreviatus]